MRYLLDTTVLIDFLRGKDSVVTLLRQLALDGHELISCCVTVAELYSGLRESERRDVDELIDNLTYASISKAHAKQAGEARQYWGSKGKTLSVADCLVASAAGAAGAVLLTANAKHFPQAGLQVEEV